MVLKRPYAFLIRHFQKIHLLLLVLCGYIFYKNAQFSSFVQEYLSLGTYDATLESVDLYVNILFYGVSIVIILISSLIIYLLHYKKKPFRFYIFVILEYIFMLGIFLYGADYFHTLTGAVAITKVLALRDLLFIASLPQYIIFIILAIRMLGLDLKKFGFQDDKEYLELESSDNEEFEFELQVDKARYKRELKKKLRFLSYFYQENKKVIQIIGCIVLVFLIGYMTYYFKVANPIYKTGDSFVANNYTIQVNNGYITNRDYRGNLILGENSKKNFVILDLTVTNHSVSRQMNVNRFHLLNRLASEVPILKYNQSFTDLGTPYENIEMKANETKRFLLIFQVDNELEMDKFVLTYQDITGIQKLKLKKVRLILQDLSDIQIKEEKKVGEEMTFLFPNQDPKNFTVLTATIEKESTYFYEKCYVNDCAIIQGSMMAPTGKDILKLNYLSDDFETNGLIDFSSRYGTISYIDNNNEVKNIPLTLLMNQKYQGNYLYISIPEEVKEETSLSIDFTIRNQKFIYKLK